jgi:Ca2+-binding RTX toxin-like protein
MSNLYFTLPEEERYSYIFEGNLQTLDHILVSYNLDSTSELDVVHRHSEQSVRPTDHDQPLARILITANDVIFGTAGNDVRDSGAGNDTFLLHQGGTDTSSGGTGNDFTYFGATFSGADAVDGGDGIDTVSLLGSYDIVLGAGQLIGVERLVMYSGSQIGGAHNSYDITTVDANVAAGDLLRVVARALLADETLTFDGSAETNGSFYFNSGAGADVLTGGQLGDYFIGGGGNDQLFGLGGKDTLIGGVGADTLTGGTEHDLFVYQSVAESTGASFDHILDFESGADKIDLGAIDANGNAADGNSAFNYIGDAAFTGHAGELRAYLNGTDWFVEGDVDGDGTADLVIQVTTVGQTPFITSDFVF